MILSTITKNIIFIIRKQIIWIVKIDYGVFFYTLRKVRNQIVKPGVDLEFSRGRRIFEKRPKKGIFRHISKNFNQKIAFFRRAKNKYLLAPKAPLEKIKGPSAKNGYLKIVQRWGPLGRQGVKCLRGWGSCAPRPLYIHYCVKLYLFVILNKC